MSRSSLKNSLSKKLTFSRIPLSGGVYNYVAILAPPFLSSFLSYVTGWVTVIAWQATSASTTFLNAMVIQALLKINYPDHKAHTWHTVLIFYAIIAVSLIITTLFGRIFPKFEAIALVLHVAGYFAILITLVYLSPKSAPQDVFQAFMNGGGWSTDGQSFLVGTVTTCWSFVGKTLDTYRVSTDFEYLLMSMARL